MDNKKCKTNPTEITKKPKTITENNSDKEIESLSKQIKELPPEEQEKCKKDLEKWIKVLLEYLSHSDEDGK
jgi:hypothetical protein